MQFSAPPRPGFEGFLESEWILSREEQFLYVYIHAYIYIFFFIFTVIQNARIAHVYTYIHNAPEIALESNYFPLSSLFLL